MDCNNNEIYHFGVKGMKWGVRRYQNYDGSYTKAGMKRFNTSMEKYEKADARYKTAKKSSASKTEITNAKLARKTAERQLKKDYKHLKQDKLGDQGKALYASGKTITGNDRMTSLLSKVGGLSVSAAAYNYKTRNLGSDTVTKYLAGAGIGMMSIAAAKQLVDNAQNKRLRAYYSHTSKY